MIMRVDDIVICEKDQDSNLNYIDLYNHMDFISYIESNIFRKFF